MGVLKTPANGAEDGEGNYQIAQRAGANDQDALYRWPMMVQSSIKQGIMNAEGLRDPLILKNMEEILPLELFV